MDRVDDYLKELPEHLRRTIAPYGEEVKTCSVDLRVGGDYHFVFVTGDGREMSFPARPVRLAGRWAVR
jgi:uncharacterized protein YndB with AHSA1/START domain